MENSAYCSWCEQPPRLCDCYSDPVSYATAPGMGSGFRQRKGEEEMDLDGLCIECGESARWCHRTRPLSELQKEKWWAARECDALQFNCSPGTFLCIYCAGSMKEKQHQKHISGCDAAVPASKRVDGHMRYLVEGGYGDAPSFPSGAYGVREPTPSDPGVLKKRKTTSRVSGLHSCSPGSMSSEGNRNIEATAKQQNGQKLELLKSNQYHQPMRSNNAGASTHTQKMTNLASVNNNAPPSSSIDSSSHRSGHRLSKGKIIPMPLIFSNKAYKKPKQLSLDSFVSGNASSSTKRRGL